jgi:FtsH-binding integral membrane protein
MKEKNKEIFKYSFAGLLVVLILSLVGILIFRDMPTENKGILTIVMGNLLAAFLTVVNFFFSSTKSSEDKTKMIYNSTPTEIDPTTPPPGKN